MDRTSPSPARSISNFAVSQACTNIGRSEITTPTNGLTFWVAVRQEQRTARHLALRKRRKNWTTFYSRTDGGCSHGNDALSPALATNDSGSWAIEAGLVCSV